jgi:hypothetical protein
MKWVFTITALLLLVESINLFQLKDKAKVQVIQLLCDHEKGDETCEIKTQVKEIDKNSSLYNSFTPIFVFFQKSTAYSRHVAMYISGFSSALYQPPE